eukprot:gb/GECH01014940.1/.p1 GENE.gb/GECH01014940.1/~~gb/GECH01014940.1/.p1  ORF type:complete len:572 (+),score=100.43 gb/GECH01014940.1/:1-1716(+)
MLFSQEEQNEISPNKMYNNTNQMNFYNDENENENQFITGFNLSIVSLPDEVFAAIMEYLSFGEVLDAVCRVCHAFKEKVYSSIRSLYISRGKTKFNHIEELFSFMERFTHLKNVKIQGFHNLTDDALNDILTSKTTLKSLHIKDCGGIKFPDLNAECVQHLKLEWTRQIQSITIHSHTLKILDIEHPGSTSFDQINLQCPHLEVLRISNANITDPVLSSTLSRLPDLRELVLEFCERIHTPSFRHLSALRHLDLSATRITDDTLTSVLKSTPSLQGLTLAFCARLRRPHIVSNTLTVLRLHGCSGLHRNRHRCLSIACPSLRELHFNSSRVSDAVLEHTVSTLPSLQKLDLRWCLGIARPALMSPTLTDLDLSYSPVDDAGLTTVLEGCPRVTTLRMYECPQVKEPATALAKLTMNTSISNTTNINNIYNNNNIDINNDNTNTTITPTRSFIPRPMTSTMTTMTTKGLRFLDLSRTNVTDGTVEQLFQDGSGRIEEVWLNWCNRLVRPTIVSPTLRRLRMVNCERLTNPVIICQELEELKLDFCAQLEKPFVRCHRPHALRWSHKNVTASQ